MEFIKFKKISYKNLLRMSEASNLDMEIVGTFLEQDVGYKSNFFLGWLISKSVITGGNVMYVSKKTGPLIGIEHGLTNDNVAITKDQFIEILQQWEKFYTARPQEIIIKKIDDKFVFEVTE